MSPAEITLTVVAVLLLLGSAAALTMWRRTRIQRDDALDAVEAMRQRHERYMQAAAEQVTAVTTERDTARAAAALAETREQIAQAAWGRAVDKLLTPAPLTITGPELVDPVDWSTVRGRHLVALDRQSVLRG